MNMSTIYMYVGIYDNLFDDFSIVYAMTGYLCECELIFACTLKLPIKCRNCNMYWQYVCPGLMITCKLYIRWRLTCMAVDQYMHGFAHDVSRPLVAICISLYPDVRTLVRKRLQYKRKHFDI